MKFFSVVLGAAALVGSVHAASGTTTAATSTATDVNSVYVECLQRCDPTDTECRASCAAVPFPSNQQVKDTNDCVSDCDQGKGTAAEIQAYIACRDDCIAKNYLTTGSSPAATGSSGDDVSGTQTSVKPTGSSASTSGADSDNNQSSQTSGSAPTATDSAGSAVVVGSSLGLFAAFAAVVAM